MGTLPDGMREVGASVPPRKPVVPPSVKASYHLTSKRLVRGCLVVVLCLAALAAVGGIGYGLGRGGCTPLPVPTPEPKPPEPKGELRVILVSDSAQNMSRGQLAALSSSKAREWLNQNCEKAGDGRPAWRSWSKEVTPGGESADWQEAWDAAKSELGTLPQIVIFHGKKGKAYPLPDSEAGFLELLKKHGK